MPFRFMKLKKKQADVAEQLIDWWDEGGFLEEGQANRLKNTLQRKSINLKKVAEYLMGLAIVSLVVAFFQLVADEWILGILERLFEISDFALFLFLIFLSLLFYGFGMRLHNQESGVPLSKHALLFMGSLAFGGALHYLGKYSEAGELFEVTMVLVFAVQAFVVSLLFRSEMLGDLGWMALFLWLGLETSRQSQWESTWMGMNLPLRFLVFSLVPLLKSLVFRRSNNLAYMALSSQRAGWVFFWVSLWLVSLFGNHSSWSSWEAAPALSLLPWGILMAAIGVGLWIFGRNNDNRLYVWMGLGGLIAVGYTQFFLFLWEPLHPALFFAIMGASFWGLGRTVERIRRG